MFAIAAIVISFPAPTAAQGGWSGTTAPRVTIARGTVPGPASVQVHRRPRVHPAELIVVDADAAPRELAAALLLVQALRAEYPDGQTESIAATPDVTLLPATWEASAHYQWVEAQLRRLDAAPTFQVPQFGVAQAIQITLPWRNGRLRPAGKRPR